jgi:hypothetical protein
MNKLITGMLLVALCCAPSIAQAGIPRAPLAAVVEAPGGQLVASAPVADSVGGTRDYAAREAANPQLGQFEGGGGWIYVGGGSVVVVLLVVLLVVLIL